MRAVILAGGRGTRLRPISSVLPKPLVPLGNKPILEILIKQLRFNGFDHVTLAVGYLAHLIKAVFGNGSKYGIKIDYSLQSKMLGTAGPLTLVKDLEGDFLVLNGDLLTDLKFKKIMDFHKKTNSLVTVGVYERTEKIDLGILEVKRGKITKYIEKPEKKFKVSSGIYVINRAALSYLKYNQYCDFPTFITRLIKYKKKLSSFEFDNYWLDLGRPDDYYKAYELFEDNPSRFLPSIKKSKKNNSK